MGPRLQSDDALLVTDVQVDFVEGALPVPRAGEIIPALNQYIREFAAKRLPVLAIRDWHPPDHMSFRENGGQWPRHCVAGTPGARFFPALALPPDVRVVSKATVREHEAYSAFDGTPLQQTLRDLGVRRLFIGGVATDYCVLETVLDARRNGYAVFVLEDAIRAIDGTPGDGERARQRMLGAGAAMLTVAQLEPGESVHG